MPVIRVALDVPLATLFDYAVPPDLAVTVGQRVLVPFGRKQMVGVVMECAINSVLAASRIKPILQVLDEIPPLTADVLALLSFCSEYYHHPPGATVLSALPVRLRSSNSIEPPKNNTGLTLRYTLSTSGRALDLETFPKRNIVQRRILSSLQTGHLNIMQLRALSDSAPTALKALLQTGWVEPYTNETVELPASTPFMQNIHTLTTEQQHAVDVVKQAQGYVCHLLHGVTGSGKTEVYVHLMRHFLQQGGQVLLLVPEINLTPQMENYFRQRLPNVAITSLHSGLNDNQRAQNWLEAQSGRARIVLGTRLAVFTPLPQLALLIVDEEHDTSFKQQDGLRYSARDVAIFRASQRAVPIVLGSATPTLESYYNAQNSRYQLLRLQQRASSRARLPEIRCINTGNTYMPHGISEPIFAALRERLQRGEQSLIFINRRGYAPVLMCTACNWLSGCPNCAGKLVLHMQDGRLRCHHCGYQKVVPHACPSCGNVDLQPIGIGTQRVASALQTYFPDARIARVDKDSTRNKGSWVAMWQKIQNAEIDILVGTQMLAKGHDFPNLTFVGVLNPDSALYSGDFRASEKLFAQLVQVAGRAGRAEKPGQVLVQTAFPDHPLYRALHDHNYDSWAQTLLAERQMAG
ncbi:MAG: primosomal protein N', partial [Candidatus Nitrotoga sp.]